MRPRSDAATTKPLRGAHHSQQRQPFAVCHMARERRSCCSFVLTLLLELIALALAVVAVTTSFWLGARAPCHCRRALNLVGQGLCDAARACAALGPQARLDPTRVCFLGLVGSTHPVWRHSRQPLPYALCVPPRIAALRPRLVVAPLQTRAGRHCRA